MCCLLPDHGPKLKSNEIVHFIKFKLISYITDHLQSFKTRLIAQITVLTWSLGSLGWPLLRNAAQDELRM